MKRVVFIENKYIQLVCTTVQTNMLPSGYQNESQNRRPPRRLAFVTTSGTFEKCGFGCQGCDAGENFEKVLATILCLKGFHGLPTHIDNMISTYVILYVPGVLQWITPVLTELKRRI